ncbi:cbb3-type cytochrome oxidase assembly protein CcoS [Shewanella corallii]|uniref:Cbb3-type cytochrome oxidase assembly protein CcoS n=1 Tax=Shewanella corallii TaxID=560080 RepID=A0ABT0NAN6_9GAMM|nr:cbb3-type cytochrome oxidase assembly protein CcoS [Shewanella corallii]MCL2914917.1 cbb3-type cytochrome oxidase assembly protein CcoS [Shewanella corallii]
MSIIYILIPIAMLFVCIAFAIFFWAVKNDQFEDLERHSTSILFDEDEPAKPSKTDEGSAQCKENTQIPDRDKH